VAATHHHYHQIQYHCHPRVIAVISVIINVIIIVIIIAIVIIIVIIIGIIIIIMTKMIKLIILLLLVLVLLLIPIPILLLLSSILANIGALSPSSPHLRVFDAQAHKSRIGVLDSRPAARRLDCALNADTVGLVVGRCPRGDIVELGVGADREVIRRCGIDTPGAFFR
jgi:hypothetical protein